MNQVEVPETFEFTKKELHKMVVKNAGKKRELVNPEFNADGPKYVPKQKVS